MAVKILTCSSVNIKTKVSYKHYKNAIYAELYLSGFSKGTEPREWNTLQMESHQIVYTIGTGQFNNGCQYAGGRAKNLMVAQSMNLGVSAVPNWHWGARKFLEDAGPQSVLDFDVSRRWQWQKQQQWRADILNTKKQRQNNSTDFPSDLFVPGPSPEVAAHTVRVSPFCLIIPENGPNNPPSLCLVLDPSKLVMKTNCHEENSALAVKLWTETTYKDGIGME